MSARMRNYRAMKTPKLERCIEELQDRAGDAYERAVANGLGVEAHLAAAREALALRGGEQS